MITPDIYVDKMDEICDEDSHHWDVSDYLTLHKNLRSIFAEQNVIATTNMDTLALVSAFQKLVNLSQLAVL